MSDHYYDKEGNPHHWVPKKDGSGNRSTTIADARKHGWLPSVSGVISVAAKPQLERWKLIQACTAVLTSPRHDGESLDAFMERVLFEDKEAEQEAALAADKGTAIHDAIAMAVNGQPFDQQWAPYVKAVLPMISAIGKVVWTEKVLVGEGYAGRADILLENESNLILTDWKTAKTMPKNGSWETHLLQTSAYGKALPETPDKRVLTANIYISTITPGETAFFVQEDWRNTYEKGFVPLLQYWRFSHSYYP